MPLPVTFKKFEQLRRPNYVLPVFMQTRKTWMLAITLAYLAGLGYSDPKDNLESVDGWLILAGASLLFLIVAIFVYKTGKKTPLFACDYSGAYVFYNDDKYVFIPWDKVRNITLDARVESASPVIVIEAVIEDAKTALELEAGYPYKQPDEQDSSSPWGGGTKLAIPFRAVSPASVLNKIYKIREEAGPGPYV